MPMSDVYSKIFDGDDDDDYCSEGEVEFECINTTTATNTTNTKINDEDNDEEGEDEDEDEDDEFVVETQEKKEIANTNANTTKIVPRQKIIQMSRVNVDDEEIEPEKTVEINKRHYYELVSLIKNLNNKLTNVENELKEIKQLVGKKNLTSFSECGKFRTSSRKADVLSWLNDDIIPTEMFDEFVQKLKVTMSNFEFLMDYKLNDAYQKIIQQNITKKENFIYPIYSSTDKANKVYVYDNDGQWVTIGIDHLSAIIKKIQQELSKQSLIWKSKNKNNDAEHEVLCQQAIKKNSSITFTQDCFMNRVRYDLRVQMQIVCKYNF